MREIKFRAWDASESKMLYHDVNYMTSSDLLRSYDDTIMQYTCLKDKNGKDIYEGDIVQVDNHIPEDGEDESFDVITQCKWDKGMFVLKDKAFGHWTRQLRHSPERLKVIGNIYENPELLEN